MNEAICRGCGKKLAAYWWRRTYDWQTGRETIEKYCPKCAACMIDDRHTNGLLCSDVMKPAED